MAGSINVNQNNNNVTIQDQNGRLTITDNNTGNTVNVTQPVTNVVTVATLGPQGPQGPQGPIGPIPTSGSFTGSFSGSFTGNLQGTASNSVSASYALTASYALNGGTGGSTFPFTGSARITGSLGVTGSISTTTQFYHSSSLDSSNRTLIDGSSNTSIDWNNRWLINSNTGTSNIKWDDAGTFGITTIPIIEKFSDTRISDELQYTYDTTRIIVSGKILEEPNLATGISDGTLVYYNTSNDLWEKFPQSSISDPSNYVTSSIGIVCNTRDVLLEGTITTIINSQNPSSSFGPTIIGDPLIGSPLFAASSLSNPTTDTVFSTQSPTTSKDTVRILGHVIGKKADVGPGRTDGYLIYFNPSNDFYTLTSEKLIGTINGNNIYVSSAATSSYLNTLNQDLTFNGNLTLNGTASISTLVVNQTVLSTGSNQLGDAINDTQTLYGTVVIPTGSLTVTGSVRSTGGFTGSLFGTSSYATQALSSSFTQTASFVQNAQSASYVLLAQTSSLALRASGSLTGSLLGTATTASYVLNAQTASFVQTAQTASYVLNAQTASFVQQAVSASFATSASFAPTASFAQTASFVQNAQTASFVQNAQTASYVTGSIFTSTNPALSASYALTSSFAVSASFATTSSFITTKTVFNQPILGTGNVGFVTRSFSQSIGSNSTGETQLLQIPIPANTFSATDKIAFFATFSKIGTANASTLRIKISTSSSMPSGSTSQIAQYTSANTSLFAKVNRELTINGGTLRGFPFTISTNNDANISTTTISSASFDITQPQYIYISAAPASASADITYLEAFEIKNI
jgi:hypothetical protein